VKKNFVSVLYALLLIGVMGCDELIIKPDPNKEESQDGIRYVIEEGGHDVSHFPSYQEDVAILKFQAKFDSSAIYTAVKPNNQADINKLYGLSDCNSLHQTNSAHFGWRWYNNQLQILAYTYNNKERDFRLIGTASMNAYHQYKIEFTADGYIFSFDNKSVTMPRNANFETSVMDIMKVGLHLQYS
jgi:hypothetical protein